LIYKIGLHTHLLVMKNYRIEIKWALIFILTGLVWAFLERLTGLHSTKINLHPYLTNLIFIPGLIIFYLALKNKRDSLGGYISFRDGFAAGMIITFIITVLAPFSQIATHFFISPDYFKNAITYTVSNGLMMPQEAQQYFSLGSYLMTAMVGTPIACFFLTAIAAAMVKKEKRIQIPTNLKN
jgi:Protein of unknown function (DUF4199)